MSLSAAQGQVAAAIKEIDDCPETVKQMFLTALPNVFGRDMHPFQKETGAFLRKSLEEARAAAGEVLVGTNQRVTEAKTVLETLQADAESTTAAEGAAQVVLNEKIAELEAAEATVTEEESLLEETKAEKDLTTEEQQKLEAAKAEAESIQNGTFRMLLDGGWEEEEVRDMCIDGVCGYLQAEGADVVLLAALPKALLLRPAECGAFDKIAVDEACRLISEKVAACTAQLANSAERFDDVNAEHLGAWAILDLAREKVQAVTEVQSNADASLKSATVDKKLALSKVMDQDATVNTILSEATLAEAKVQQLDLALVALTQLETGEELVDKENKENVVLPMEVDQECKDKTMVFDQVSQVPMTA